MLHLLESWNVGGPLRRPWCVLEAAKCPTDDKSFVRWARAQILRLNSAEGRRFEQRFANWPYPLYALQSEKYTEAAKDEVIVRLLAATRRELDTYALGLRTLFPAATAPKAHECESVLHRCSLPWSRHRFRGVPQLPADVGQHCSRSRATHCDGREGVLDQAGL